MVEGFRRWARPGSATPVAHRPTRLRPPGNRRFSHVPGSVVASRCTALGLDRTDLRCRSLRAGVQIDPHALRLQRDSRALTPDSHQPVRVHPASELGQAEVALRSRQEPAHCLSGRQAASLGRPWRSATRAVRHLPDRSPERSPDGHGRAPAPSRKSPLHPRAEIIGALRDGALCADRIDPDPSRFGVGFRSTSTRRTCSETRVLSRPTPTSPSGSIRRANWGKPR